MDIVDFREPDRGRLSADPARQRTAIAETLQGFTLGNRCAGQGCNRGIGKVQPQPLLLGVRQSGSLRASDKSRKLADNAHVTIALGDGDWLSMVGFIAESR